MHNGLPAMFNTRCSTTPLHPGTRERCSRAETGAHTSPLFPSSFARCSANWHCQSLHHGLPAVERRRLQHLGPRAGRRLERRGGPGPGL